LTVSRDEIERARLESEFKFALDYQSDMVSSRREGLAEGLEKGETKGWKKRDKEARREKLESARKLKNMGVPPDKIAVGLGFTVEEIERL
jgi:predicted transposase/invertase (TIGR01784 family)